MKLVTSCSGSLTLIGWLAFIPIIAEAQALNPPYLSEMPTVERVKREIQGADPMDTAARQAGAFAQLRQIIYDLALSQRRDRNEVTSDEKRLADAYYAAAYYASQPIEKSLSNSDGKLTCPGPVDIKGKVVAGYTTQQTRQNKQIQEYEAPQYSPSSLSRDALGNLYADVPATVTIPIYRPKTERCSLAKAARFRVWTGWNVNRLRAGPNQWTRGRSSHIRLQ